MNEVTSTQVHVKLPVPQSPHGPSGVVAIIIIILLLLLASGPPGRAGAERRV